MLVLDRHRRCERVKWEGVVFTLHPAACTGSGMSMVSTDVDISMGTMELFRRAHKHHPFFRHDGHYLPDVPLLSS